jgi:hypothetical protein
VSIAEPTDSQIAIIYFNPAGTAVADCDDSDPTLPSPTAEIIVSGSTVEVAITKDYEAIVPLLGRFIDGITLDSTQTRGIHQGVLGAS